MRIQLGIPICLLAGCVVQPTHVEPQVAGSPKQDLSQRQLDSDTAPPHPTASDVREAIHPHLALLRRGNPLRIGIEFLPPRGEESAFAVRATPSRAESVAEKPRALMQPPERSRPIDRKNRHTWTMSTDDLEAIRDPIARETMQFIDDVMGEDRRRLKRNLGTPILTMQTIDLQSPGIDLRADERQIEDEAIWATDHGMGLLKRPLRHLLKRLPIVRDAELRLDEFKSDNVPLSKAYRHSHRSRSPGRVWLRR